MVNIVYGHINIDSIEHLRMSWLVSQGYVPFRDFFEHHNPLLWYVYLPFTILLPHNFYLVFYFSRMFCAVFAALMVFVICKIIKRYMGGKEIIPYFLVILFSFYLLWWWFVTLKPEILAYPLYFSGIYLFFRYSENLKTKYLVWCGIAFAAAFLVIQNIVFSIAPLVVPLFYLWNKNPKVGKDILLSAIAPIVMTTVFVGLLYVSGSWKNYYELCWIFNYHLFGLFFYNTTNFLLYWSVPVACGAALWLWLVYKKQSSFYINTIGLLLCCEIVQRIIAKAGLAHYLVLTFIFISVILAIVAAKIKEKPVLKIIYIVLITMLMINFARVLFVDNNTQLLKNYEIVNSSPENTVLNVSFEDTMNIWEPKKSYYVLFTGLTLIDNYLFDRDPEYDINKYIEDNKIKYIDWCYEPYTPLYFDGDDFFDRFNIKPEILEKYTNIYHCLWQRTDTLEQTTMPKQSE